LAYVTKASHIYNNYIDSTGYTFYASDTRK